MNNLFSGSCWRTSHTWFWHRWFWHRMERAWWQRSWRLGGSEAQRQWWLIVISGIVKEKTGDTEVRVTMYLRDERIWQQVEWRPGCWSWWWLLQTHCRQQLWQSGNHNTTKTLIYSSYSPTNNSIIINTCRVSSLFCCSQETTTQVMQVPIYNSDLSKSYSNQDT